MTLRRQALGAAGEQRVAEWYEERGYTVLARNWRHGRGELDLVLAAPGGHTVVFCEVKTRASAAFGSGLESLTPTKATQVRRLAAAWLRACPERWDGIRFDAAGVTGGHVDIVADAF